MSSNDCEIGGYHESYETTLKPKALSDTYAFLRESYDPIPTGVDVETFTYCVENMRLFQSVFESEVITPQQTYNLRGHVFTLAYIIYDHVLRLSADLLEPNRLVSFTPGSCEWKSDIEDATKKVIKQAKEEEVEEFAEFNFFGGGIEPKSIKAEKEILHQFITCKNLKQRLAGPYGEDQLEYVMTAKDVMYATLMRRYLSTLRSRAWK